MRYDGSSQPPTPQDQNDPLPISQYQVQKEAFRDVHVLICLSCLCSIRGSTTILVRWFQCCGLLVSLCVYITIDIKPRTVSSCSALATARVQGWFLTFYNSSLMRWLVWLPATELVRPCEPGCWDHQEGDSWLCSSVMWNSDDLLLSTLQSFNDLDIHLQW